MANEEALRQLRRVAEEAPDDRLHMRSFTETGPCGTAHCLAGWAEIDPWFLTNTPLPAVLAMYTDGQPGEGERTFAGLAAVFGLKQEDADNLFGSDLTPSVGPHAVSKAEVLWNIDQLLAGQPALPYAATRADVPEYAGGIPNEDFDEDDSDEDDSDEDDSDEDDSDEDDSDEDDSDEDN
jgi:hypothetical protein